MVVEEKVLWADGRRGGGVRNGGKSVMRSRSLFFNFIFIAGNN